MSRDGLQTPNRAVCAVPFFVGLPPGRRPANRSACRRPRGAQSSEQKASIRLPHRKTRCKPGRGLNASGQSRRRRPAGRGVESAKIATSARRIRSFPYPNRGKKIPRPGKLPAFQDVTNSARGSNMGAQRGWGPVSYRRSGRLKNAFFRKARVSAGSRSAPSQGCAEARTGKHDRRLRGDDREDRRFPASAKRLAPEFRPLRATRGVLRTALRARTVFSRRLPKRSGRSDA